MPTDIIGMVFLLIYQKYYFYFQLHVQYIVILHDLDW